MGKLTWQQVILFLGITISVLVGAIVLVVLDKNVEVILTIIALIASPILAAAGASIYQRVDQKLDNIKEVSNGTLGTALAMLKEAHERNYTLALTNAAATNGEKEKERQ